MRQCHAGGLFVVRNLKVNYVPAIITLTILKCMSGFREPSCEAAVCLVEILETSTISDSRKLQSTIVCTL